MAGNFVTWTRFDGHNADVFYRDLNLIGDSKVSSYTGQTYNCHVTKVVNQAAMLYTIDGPFTGPKWAVYYRGPDGFGGNTENDGVISRGKFVISLPTTVVTTNSFMVSSTEACNFTVYDASGRKVKQIQANKAGVSQTRIDCEDWAKGTYFIVASSNGKVKTSKVVIMH